MIDNAEAIRFVNEVVRPMAERLRDEFHRLSDAQLQWFGGINNLIANDGQEELADGREAEGISRLDGADIHLFMANALNVLAVLNGGGVMGVIAKPAVRQLAT